MLEKMGYRVDIAPDGYQAVTLAMANRYDLVLMDCSMPEMDGYQATAEIRRLHKEGALRRIPVIALTANALPEDRERCLAAGMDDYLSKPIARDDLRTMLDKYLSGASGNATASAACRRAAARTLQYALLTTPPSTRSAAPVVADESGLAT
jgi:two-component system, sensor histidine kinase and response regulator